MSSSSPIDVLRSAARCAVCGEGFDPEAWIARHTEDEADLHEECCVTAGPCRPVTAHDEVAVPPDVEPYVPFTAFDPELHADCGPEEPCQQAQHRTCAYPEDVHGAHDLDACEDALVEDEEDEVEDRPEPDLLVCSDCAVWHANGDSSGIDDPEREYEVRRARLLAGRSITTGDEAGFSWSRCGACGTTLGGDRHEAWLLPPHHRGEVCRCGGIIRFLGGQWVHIQTDLAHCAGGLTPAQPAELDEARSCTICGEEAVEVDPGSGLYRHADPTDAHGLFRSHLVRLA